MSVMKTTRDVRGVGLSIPRPDGPEKVTGHVQYVADITPRGLLHAKLLRSPHAHARIVRIDTEKARALPGVRAVLTAADIPELKKKAPTRAHAVLAIERVVFAGQPVAAVAADEPAIAEEALDLIDVQYEVLAAAVDPLLSMKPGAPPVADAGTEADTSEALAHSAVAMAKSAAAAPAKAVNVTQTSNVKRGDVAKGFAESDLVLEHTYRVPMVHQGYIEPHAVLAEWDTTGQLTLWASTQGSFNTRSEVADVLGIEENRIKVIPVECGGGFGGKIRALCEPITAILARATGRPVRYVMTRREELEAGMPAPQVIIRLKTGVKRDGTLMALEAETVLESGAFSGTVLAVSAVFLGSLYKWPAFDITGSEVLTHKPSVAAYRAPVAPQSIFAIDSQMDQLARALNLDPVEFRARHLSRPGEPMANNQPWASNGAHEVLARAAAHPMWKDRAKWKGTANGKLRGTGLGLGGWLGGLQPTAASVKLNPDGTLSVLTGQVDIAGTNIALAQIAASTFGVDIEKVKITTGDTDVAPVTGLSAGSKTVYTVGVAVMQAAQDARRQTLEIAAGELEAAMQDLEIVDGRVVVRGVPDRGITLTQIGRKGNLYMSKIPPVLGSAHTAFTQQAPAFAAQIARIEVDPDTGDLTLHDFVVVQDVGKAINPLAVEGQMQGGAVQSLGIALTEALTYDDAGRLTNPSLLDYRKLTAADLPNIETVIVEVPSPAGPFGARGVGEPPIIPAPAAIANAIHDATGVRLTELPLTPERIALALSAAGTVR
jgi:CO/xanthine dehydrogenase Mo-binding subunit